MTQTYTVPLKAIDANRYDVRQYRNLLPLMQDIAANGVQNRPVLAPRPWWALWRKPYDCIVGCSRIKALVALGHTAASVDVKA